MVTVDVPVVQLKMLLIMRLRLVVFVPLLIILGLEVRSGLWDVPTFIPTLEIHHG